MPQATMDGRVVRAQQRKERTHRTLLETAGHVFGQRGYHDTSIQDLLDAAGIARGTFYLHFDSKRSAFQAVLDGLIQDVVACLVRVDITSSVPPRVQLLGNLKRALQVLAQDIDLARMLFAHASGLSPEVDDLLSDFYAKVHALLLRSLLRGRTLGLVEVEDLDLYAAFLFGGIKETFLYASKGDSSIDPDSLAEHMLSLALQGLTL